MFSLAFTKVKVNINGLYLFFLSFINFKEEITAVKEVRANNSGVQSDQNSSSESDGSESVSLKFPNLIENKLAVC